MFILLPQTTKEKLGFVIHYLTGTSCNQIMHANSTFCPPDYNFKTQLCYHSVFVLGDSCSQTNGVQAEIIIRTDSLKSNRILYRSRNLPSCAGKITPKADSQKNYQLGKNKSCLIKSVFGDYESHLLRCRNLPSWKSRINPRLKLLATVREIINSVKIGQISLYLRIRTHYSFTLLETRRLSWHKLNRSRLRERDYLAESGRLPVAVLFFLYSRTGNIHAVRYNLPRGSLGFRTDHVDMPPPFSRTVFFVHTFQMKTPRVGACSSLAPLKFVVYTLLALIRLMLTETNVNCSGAGPFRAEESPFTPFKLLMATASRFCLSGTCHLPIHKRNFNFYNSEKNQVRIYPWKVQHPSLYV